jgi:pyruvate-formate lyase-activating enzyme
MGYWTCQFPFASRLSDLIRARSPRTLIIHGGVHATLFPEIVAEHCDRVVCHEGERVFPDLVERMREGAGFEDIPGLAWKAEGVLATSPPAQFIENLDDLPFPAWDLLDLEHYTTQLHVVGGRRFPIIGSRGCPYNCSFCSSPKLWERKVRFRSPGNVVDEMAFDKKTYGISCFHFWDDNLLLNEKFITEIAEDILRRNLDVKWLGLSRSSHVVRSERLMPLLKRSGLVGFEIGIESSNPEAYDIAQKDGETLDSIRRACDIQKALGLAPMYTYMSYLPGDTIRKMHEQGRFMDSLLEGLPRYKYFHNLPFDLYLGQCTTPHMGTPFHDEASQLGRPMWRDEEDFHHSATCFLPNTLLEDRPLRRRETLPWKARAYALISGAVTIADFLTHDRPLTRMRNVAACNRLLARFWSACDGTRTFLSIAQGLHGEDPMDLDLDDMIKLMAAACLAWAQLGILDSAQPGTEAPMKAKDIPYRLAPLYGLLNALCVLYGKAAGVRNFQFPHHHSYLT